MSDGYATYRVEAIDRHDDGSTTLYCRSHDTDELFVQTFPPGATVQVRAR